MQRHTQYALYAEKSFNQLELREPLRARARVASE
jgi:hypothetical protein